MQVERKKERMDKFSEKLKEKQALKGEIHDDKQNENGCHPRRRLVVSTNVSQTFNCILFLNLDPLSISATFCFSLES